MKKVLIIGGGLSGISAAVFLTNAGYKTEIVESAPKFGGRTYSLKYNKTRVDNGQHILMECYGNTLEYIDLIGAKDLFEFQDSLNINYVNENKEVVKLIIPNCFHPLDKIIGLLRFKLISYRDRILVLKLLIKIKLIKSSKYSDYTVFNFLKNNNQSKKVIDVFWENVVVSTMNTSTKIASAEMFIDMIKIIFFKDKRSANIVIPKVDLTDALIQPGIVKLTDSKSNVSTSEKVLEFVTESDKIVAVKTNNRVIDDFDYIISAMPVYSLGRILENSKINNFVLPTLKYSPIISVHVWLSENPLKEKMYNLVGSEFDWVFNHGKYITFIKSKAEYLASLNKNIVIKIVFSELKKYFTILTNIEIIDYIVLKEMKATFIPDQSSVEERKLLQNPLSNLFIAGDWTNTGLPATIEGAIKSGKDVSTKIIMQN